MSLLYIISMSLCPARKTSRCGISPLEYGLCIIRKAVSDWLSPRLANVTPNDSTRALFSTDDATISLLNLLILAREDAMTQYG